jgi:UDP-glucuronate 4-epimerase
MRVLVTGGAGFIGSHASQRLLARGDEVVIVDDLNNFYDPEIKKRNLEEIARQGQFRFHHCDIRMAEQLREIFEREKPDAVIHLAARAGVRPSLVAPVLYEEVNVIGTIHLLELCRKGQIKNFVFGSSSSVYGVNSKLPFSEDDPIDHPISPYATTKRSGELLAFNYSYLYGVLVTCLRFFTVYGPRQRPEMGIHKFTRKIIAGEEIEIYGDGESCRDYTYVDDIIAGLLAALDRPRPFAIYNLGNSSPTTLNSLIATIEQATGKSARRKYMPDQPGDVPATYADIRRASQDLNFEPRVDLQTGIDRFVKWYNER